MADEQGKRPTPFFTVFDNTEQIRADIQSLQLEPKVQGKENADDRKRHSNAVSTRHTDVENVSSWRPQVNVWKGAAEPVVKSESNPLNRSVDKTMLAAGSAAPNNMLLIRNLPPGGSVHFILGSMFGGYPGFKGGGIVETKPYDGFNGAWMEENEAEIAFVEYETEAQAMVAMKTFQGFRVLGQDPKMVITYAKKGFSGNLLRFTFGGKDNYSSFRHLKC